MKEKLSALIDAELDELEEWRVLDALATDPELRRTWGRYHLIRAAVTRQLGTLAPSDLPERVLVQLDTEPAVAASLRFWPLAGGFAAAASLAAVAILGLQALRGPTDPTAVTPLAVAPTSASAPAPTTEVASAAPVAPATANSEERLSRYLVGHNEFMPTAGMGSMLPYVRVVAHGPDK